MGNMFEQFGPAVTQTAPTNMFERFGGGQPQQDTPTAPQQAAAPPALNPSDVPQWGRENPNAYAALMTAKHMLTPPDSPTGPGALDNQMREIAPAMIGGVAGELKPIFAGAEEAGKNWLQGVAERLYGSATKMPLTEKWLKAGPRGISMRAQAVQSGLDNAIMPNEEGLAKVKSLLDSTNLKIAATFKSGDSIATADAIKPLEELKTRYSALPSSIRDPIYSEIDGLRDSVLTDHPTTIPAQQAQEMKQAIYQMVSKHYGDMKGAAIEAQKQLARGLKDALVETYPDLTKLNAEDSGLIQLQKALERTVGRLNNRDMIGLGETIAGGAGAAVGSLLGGPAGAAAGSLVGVARRIADSPEVKTRVALLLNKASKMKVPPMINDAAPMINEARMPAVIGKAAYEDNRQRQTYTPRQRDNWARIHKLDTATADKILTGRGGFLVE